MVDIILKISGITLNANGLIILIKNNFGLDYLKSALYEFIYICIFCIPYIYATLKIKSCKPI